MATLRRLFIVTSLVLVFSAFLGACGGGQPASTTNTSSSSMGTNYQGMGTATSTMYATPTEQNMMNPTATPTMGNTGDMNAFIHTTVVMINMNKVHVLTTNKGFLLYYYKKDSMLTSTCTGTCAKTWPPLLAPQGMMTVTSSVMLPKILSVHQTANGEQVFYDGHALYTYAGDMAPGQFNGRGIGNAWYLVGFTL